MTYNNGKAFTMQFHAMVMSVLVVLGLGLAQASTTTLVTHPPPTCHSSNIFLRFSADLPLLSTCQTLPGNLFISASFSGAVTLPSLTLIGGSLAVDPDYPVLFDVDEINFPDLIVVIDGLELRGLLGLRQLHMPKLKSLGSGAQPHTPSPMLSRIIQNGGPPMNLSFPELEEVGMAWFEGNFESIDFPKLQRARYIYIKSTADLDCNIVIMQLSHIKFSDGELECHSTFESNNSDEEVVSKGKEKSCDDGSEGLSGGSGDGVVASVLGWTEQIVVGVKRLLL